MTPQIDAPAPKHVPIPHSQAEKERHETIAAYYMDNQGALEKVGINDVKMISEVDKTNGIVMVARPEDKFECFVKEAKEGTTFFESYGISTTAPTFI